ncbi:glycoside-pentoside-hexuronide (GPH):cation symporter [Aestuariibacter halophilus]|uniref:Glycoside-pentoside-hexuronide (GPH):cation symporter n=1 Tax=Fluctibacter halophilus TaxID=226011 RepID=A0ABS8G8V5_9ALTE|nr:glycoside-pentoside-hexuronide (GPH):cation symporter [Aestuariibacter halophilus]MCC2616601.1 glycoside-pentoside-hexuronide (GPH):cation symporter [Aestuariibacter halophilus]
MVSVREKVAYGLGDTASNIIFQTVMLFLTYFYTDIFGLSPAVVGTMFLVVRIFDAVTDPLMGALADRTRTRHGAYRPYLLWLAVPFGICSVLAFTTPDLSPDGKVLYAYATYALLMLAYTAINIPYSALGGVLSPDPDERVAIQGYRFVFGMSGGLIVSMLTLSLVDYFGNGDAAYGYQMTMVVMSIMGVAMFLACFAGTKERVKPSTATQSSFVEQAKAMWQNDQWRVLCVVAILLLTGMVLKTSLAIFYIKYYLQRPDLVTTIITIGMLGNILGCALAHPLSQRMCKVRAYQMLQVFAAVLTAASYWVAGDQLYLAVGLYFLWCFSIQMATPLLWAKIADTVDYGHYKTGVRLTGVTYSSVVFFIKFGLALGGALGGWLLGVYGYVAEQAQSQETLQGLLLSFSVYPALASIGVALCMCFYRLKRDKVLAMQEKLAISG